MAGGDVLEMINIDKRFGGIHALRGFNFSCAAGEVHVLMGENGAGKSTLLNILGGIYQSDGGEIRINGKAVQITNPIDFIKASSYGSGTTSSRFILSLLIVTS